MTAGVVALDRSPGVAVRLMAAVTQDHKSPDAVRLQHVTSADHGVGVWCNKTSIPIILVKSIYLRFGIIGNVNKKIVSDFGFEFHWSKELLVNIRLCGVLSGGVG
ncbi:hypothetical protein [Mycobacterium sp.]|uniref:hypothetical protein n=1 Tax=Mycobacterium sp. TaxID=1785 RepID=UPI003BAA8CED